MATSLDIPEPLTRHLSAIDAALREVAGNDSRELDAAVRYVLGWENADGEPVEPGGKRIRPALCLLAAECCRAPAEAALPGAVAVEFIHNFSLVHDDIQDRDRERHGRPTLWSRLGEAQAINAGDFLFTSASMTLTRAEHNSAGQRIRALDVLAAAVAEMIRGQWMDISFETSPSVSLEDYMAMVTGKTSALLGAALEMGAILAGAPEETSGRLGQWGRALGLAFQAHDDLLGVWGRPALTGKSTTSDIARKKRSLPIVLALADDTSSEVIQEEYAPANPTPDVERVLQALAACDAQSRAETIARDHAATASALLETLDIAPECRDELAVVADYVVNRER